jgi:hypothetical protein
MGGKMSATAEKRSSEVVNRAAIEVDRRSSEVVNRVAIEALSLGTHGKAGKRSPVLGTPTEVMQHIGELAMQSEYLIPRNIILAGGASGRSSENRSMVTIERIEIGGDEGTILTSQSLLPELPFMIWGYSAVTLGTDEPKGLLIGGLFQMIGSRELDHQKTVEFEFSTKNWDIKHPRTKHWRHHSSSSILPGGSSAICGGILSEKSTEIRGEDGEWNLSETAILHIGRRHPGTTVVNGSMFAIGGLAEDGPTNTVEMWDPRDKSGWQNDSSILSMQKRRWAHSVLSVGDSIFVFGGSAEFDNSCESLDIRSNKWISISSMPLIRSSHSSIVIRDHVLVVAGWPETTQIDSYDLITNTWTTLPLELLHSRWGFQAFAL